MLFLSSRSVAHPSLGSDGTVLPLILASASPRRRELLAVLGLPFTVVASQVDEDSPITEPAVLACTLAEQKALAVAQAYPEAVILAADTVVACAGQLLGKPADQHQNLHFLRQLSGRTQQVYTGVAVWRAGQLLSEVGQTALTFRALSEAEMRYYTATGEGLDKAGGYGIQGLGAALVSLIEGEYSNVVGLPLSVTIQLLRAQGVAVWNESYRP